MGREANAAYLDAISELVATLLHEPLARSQIIAQGAIEEASRSFRVWQSLQALEHEAALARAAEINWHHEEALRIFINQNPRGILVTTIHASDYLLALLKLRQMLQSDRKIIIVRKKAADAMEVGVFKHFSIGGNPVEVVRHSDNKSLRLIRALRAGDIVVALFDLPSSFGITSRLEFLGHPMQLVKGPGELAVAGKADVLPFMCHHQGVQVHAIPSSPIRSRSAFSISQQLCDIASKHIHQHPEQWQHWYHVPKMLEGAL